MKKILVTCFLSLVAIGFANAGVTVYYSPSCPHCHNALNFFDAENINVEKINVTESGNQNAFIDALKKCEFTSGGVPVIVIDEKCWQGYAPFMDTELRDAAAGSTTTVQEEKSSTWFYAVLIAIVAGLGFIILRKKK